MDWSGTEIYGAEACPSFRSFLARADVDGFIVGSSSVYVATWADASAIRFAAAAAAVETVEDGCCGARS